MNGDLLKTYNFTDSRKRKYYMYHCVLLDQNGYLKIVPVTRLSGVCPSNHGGECWLSAISCKDGSNFCLDSEVIDGIPDIYDRKRVKRVIPEQLVEPEVEIRHA